MIETVSRWLTGVPGRRLEGILRSIMASMADRFSTQCLTSAGLVIKAGGGVLVKAGSITYVLVVGRLIKLAANTDMAALSGTVLNTKFNVFAFYVDAAGTLTSQMGTEGATLGAVVLPPLPVNKALIGYLVVNPTGTGNFVGGTTALDDATVVPNAAYLNAIGPMDPTVIL